MMCEKCGADNAEGTAKCVLCGSDLGAAQEKDEVLSAFAKYIAWPAILTSIGIAISVALVFIFG